MMVPWWLGDELREGVGCCRNQQRGKCHQGQAGGGAEHPQEGGSVSCKTNEAIHFDLRWGSNVDLKLDSVGANDPRQKDSLTLRWRPGRSGNPK